DLLLGQKDIIFFTAKGTIPHHQLRQLPNDLFSMIHVRNECVTLRGLLLMQCIIENELPLRADQDVIAGKELAVFHAEDRGIDISPGVAVASSQSILLLFVFFQPGQKLRLDLFDCFGDRLCLAWLVLLFLRRDLTLLATTVIPISLLLA